MSQGPDAEQGFVLLDALVAVAILGLVGTGTVALFASQIDAQTRQLEHSAVMLTAEGLIEQYVRFGPNPDGPRVREGGLEYELTPVAGAVEGTTRLRRMAVVARKGTSGPELLRLEFIAPVFK